MSSTQEHETDSSFAFRKRQPVKIESHENDENDENTKFAVTKPISISAPPVILQKKSNPPKLVQVKPVSLVGPPSQQHESPNKNRIDKIADNLKIQQQRKLVQAPRVSLVSKTANKKQNVLQNSSNRSLTNQLHLVLLNNLKTCKLDLEDVESQDLTNLNWLTNFDMSTAGLSPLSPPQSPTQPRTTTKLSSVLFEDESDGCSSIKPWLPSASLSPESPKWCSQPQLQRPLYSFSCLTFLAIEASPRKRLSVKEIYSWITQNFPYYRSVPSGSWKNSIRHNLSFNQCFTKVDKNLLTMRDFSGKGSLWSINPEFRPLLVDSLLKTPTHEQNKLASIPCLQDVSEVPKVASLNSLNSLNSRSSRIVSSRPAFINPKLANKFISTQARSQSHSKPNITAVSSSLSKLSNEAALSSSQENCTELDAVNALLSMKSRASSMPAASFNLSADSISTPKKGRRKQLFKPPIKNTYKRGLEIEDELTDDEEIEALNEIDFEEGDNSEDEIYKSSLMKIRKSNKRSSKKLFVKFTSFKNKNYTKEVCLDEEKCLQIDESVDLETDEDDDLDTISKKRKSLEVDHNAKKSKTKISKNPLLELSRAAFMIEEQKDL